MPGVAQRTDEPAGERTDVRAPMAADLRLVADAAERHADELAVERARDRLADRRLAGAGRPDQREDRARLAVGLDAALLAELRDGDVLDDPVLDVVETGVVGVEHLARVAPGRAAPRSACPTGRRGASRGSSGSCSPRVSSRPSARTGRARARPARARRRASPTRRSSCGTPRRRSPRRRRAPCGSSRSAGAGCTRAAASRRRCSTSSWMRFAHLHQREPLALELERELETLVHVDGLEELHLLLEREVGRVARGVGERAGLGDRADERRDAAVVAAQLEDLLDDRAVLALELADLAVGRNLVRALLDLDEEPALRVDLGRAGDTTMEAASARPRDRRREAGRDRSPRRPCRRSRTRPRAWGRAGHGSSSPTSTVSVTFMFGKTTMSSSGTSKSLLTGYLTLLGSNGFGIEVQKLVPTTGKSYAVFRLSASAAKRAVSGDPATRPASTSEDARRLQPTDTS